MNNPEIRQEDCQGQFMNECPWPACMCAQKIADRRDFDPIIKFLLGEESLNGLNFGDKAFNQPPFWWRKLLRKYIQDTNDELAKANDRIRELESIVENVKG